MKTLPAKDTAHGNTAYFPQKWMALSAVMTGGFMFSVDSSVMNLILPTLVDDLKTDFTMAQWVILSKLLTITSLIMIMGRLGDLLGKKQIYFSGFVIFTLGSLLCGLAGSIWWLIASRVIQGIGGAMIVSLGLAVATEAFPAAERGKAMGILASGVTLGLVIGPVLGGILLNTLPWNWIFFINVPLGLIGSYLVSRYVSVTISHKQTGFDLIGAALFFLSMLTFVVGLTLGQKGEFFSAWPLALFTCSFLCALSFVITENRIPSPLVAIALLKNVRLSANLTVIFLYYFSLSGIFILAPFYFQGVLGIPPGRMGLLFACMSLMIVLFSPLSGTLSDRLGTSAIICLTLTLTAIAYLVFSFNLHTETTIKTCVIGMLWIGICLGLYMSPSHSAVMGAVPKEHLGIISSLLMLCRTLGQTAGVAVLGTVWVVRTKHHSSDAVDTAIYAPIEARLQGMQDISTLCIILIGVAFTIAALTPIQRFGKVATTVRK